MNVMSDDVFRGSRCPACSGEGKGIGSIHYSLLDMEAMHFLCSECETRWVHRSDSSESLPMEVDVRVEPENTSNWIADYLPSNFFNVKERRVLDIGCWAGGLLRSLPQTWEKHGVELNGRAAERAREAGLKVWSGRIEEYSGSEEEPYDVIFMLDVIEHISTPSVVIERIGSFLSDSGRLILLTGDATSFASRWFGPRWYYLNYPEHVFCPSRKGLTLLLEGNGLTMERIESVRHYTSGTGELVRKFAGRMTGRDRLDKKLALPNPALFSDRLNLILSRIIRGKDHLIAVARKGHLSTV